MRWDQGRATIEKMLGDNDLQRVPASREQAGFLIGQARRHIASAKAITDADPPGAYQLAYDAARKAMVAILENQGLRSTSAGGHVAVYEAVRAQLDPPMGRVIRPFNRMRRRRNDSEYPTPDQPAVERDDVDGDLPKAEEIVDLAQRVISEMDAF